MTDAEWERLAERDVPERYGNWNTIYDRFSTWRDDGTWARLLQAVLADVQRAGDAGPVLPPPASDGPGAG
ncbi:transposase [Catenulispora rubra]|uniref:transposase n=1 Tax=Catenulispora rubra TaxID=280293 RepID=UPI0034DCD7B4